VKLLLDEMYPRRLAEQLRASGHDVVAVVERPDLVGRDDATVLAYARQEERVVVTENVVDYATADAAEHVGLLLVNARRWPRTPSGLPRLAQAIQAHLEIAGRPSGLVEWL
jgi:hypothetical protein